MGVTVSFAATFLVIAGLLTGPAAAQTVSCRNYPEAVRSKLKPAVAALRLVEREAVDRIIGLDTRPYPYLAAQAQGLAEVLADAKVLAAEQELNQCRNHVLPVRTLCREAALALARLIEEQATRAASDASKRNYTQNIGQCERSMNLPPLKTAFRAAD